MVYERRYQGAHAQYNLANMYREARHVAPEEASKWYLRAALQGDKYARMLWDMC